ncbi:MAG: hypothetical protein CMO55_04115 [Verrucomicrobiales bacterium]|nr:hypothetical protein [Verrucomicrobiales bacterium]
MIVWLASYPRSGNTLLRTVLCVTLGEKSYADPGSWSRILERDPVRVQLDKKLDAIVNYSRMPEESWESFYPKALVDEQLHLVKSHDSPSDDCRAIYIVRDGRKSCYSYSLFHKDRLPQEKRTLLEVVTGDDYFGDWTSSYKAWNDFRRPDSKTLLLRFEEVVNASGETVSTIAEFLGISGTEKESPWENPFQELQNARPDFFREGQVAWTGEEGWTNEVEWTFRLFHGELMTELGYELGPEPEMTDKEIARAASQVLHILDHPRVPFRAVQRDPEEEARIRAVCESVK